MSARVSIEAEAWSDIRFTTLARLCGLADAEHALIKCARIWGWQTEFYRPETPTYVVDRDTIESVLGADGPEAMVRAKLAEETPDGWRIRGSRGRIEWLYNRRVSSIRGGEANKRRLESEASAHSNGNASHKRQPPGSVVASQVDSQSQAKVEPSDLDLISGDQNALSRAHAIPRAPVHGAPERGPIAVDAWGYAATTHAALKREGLDPESPSWPVMPDGSSRPWQELLARVDELLRSSDRLRAKEIAHRRVDVAAAEARKAGHLDWFIPIRMWDAKSFAIGSSLSPAQAARAGPRPANKTPGPASPRNDHVESREPVPFGDKLR